jgi:sensor histidine kinase YesM
MAPLPAPRLASSLRAGFSFSRTTLLLIIAIDTAIALVLWIDDPRPFWHPLVTVQLYGLSIAYCINVAAPWDHDRPLRRLAVAALVGSLIGVVFVIVIKGYPLSQVRERFGFFAMNVAAAFGNGLLISLIFYVKRRETRAAAALHQAEAERHLLSKQAVEAELKLMQAQVEPHFLFNTLASVQYLIETDPKQASGLLAHLIDYLRAALPQLRARSSTLAREISLVEAYLNILATRLGPRLRFAIDLPDELRDHPFPPNLIISLVENAIKHGIEPSPDGGSVTLSASRRDGSLIVSVTDTGCGASPEAATSGQGVGLTNVRERLQALYGARARFSLEPASPRGMRAMLCLPDDVDDGRTHSRGGGAA